MSEKNTSTINADDIAGVELLGNKRFMSYLVISSDDC